MLNDKECQVSDVGRGYNKCGSLIELEQVRSIAN